MEPRDIRIYCGKLGYISTWSDHLSDYREQCRRLAIGYFHHCHLEGLLWIESSESNRTLLDPRSNIPKTQI